MKRMKVWMAAALLVTAYILSSQPVAARVMEAHRKKVVVLDAGHGGIDGGKVSVTGTLEKDLNLAIVKKVKVLLEQEGESVVLTRTGDEGLYQETDANKKMTDLKKRCEIMAENRSLLAVSIHQNSFNSASACGAQVFYYEGSEEGEKLAEVLQQKINENMEGEHTRSIKANSDYYLLRKSCCPCVIVECGFLSNPEEARRLEEEGYQNRMAECIAKGILEYMDLH